MNCLFWNYRCIGISDTRWVLKMICLNNKPYILCIAKPMVVWSVVPEHFQRSWVLSY